MSVHKDKSNGTWYVKYKNNTKRGFKNKKTAENFEAELITGLKEPKKRKQNLVVRSVAIPKHADARMIGNNSSSTIMANL